MPDISAIAGAVSALKNTTDLLKLLIGARDANVVREHMIELQGAIYAAQQNALTAQSDQVAALDRIRDLERQIADAKTWDGEKNKYQLHQFAPGIFTYRLKPLVQEGALEHDLCANCYRNSVKSVIQRIGKGPERFWKHLCPSCNFQFESTVSFRPAVHDLPSG